MADLLSIRKDISRQTRIALAVASWGTILAVWLAVTHWEVLPPLSLPRPAGVIRALGNLWTEYDLLGNVAMMTVNPILPKRLRRPLSPELRDTLRLAKELRQ